ncbi:MAG: hypothetical protein NWR22_03670, partial [Saprospiraceae bacterium]|nr:hypothetical protein [Saprospiraceae bacterium]
DTVKNYANARKLITLCYHFSSEAFDTPADGIPALVDQAEREVFDVGCTTRESGFTHIASIMGDITDSIFGMATNDPRYTGLPTTFKEIDDIIVGLRQQEVIVLAARPSLGKTSLALNIQRRMAMAGHPVGIVSLEMGRVKLGQRQVFEHAGIDSKKVCTGGLTKMDLTNQLLEDWLPFYPGQLKFQLFFAKNRALHYFL